jgi:hypothetical protein
MANNEKSELPEPTFDKQIEVYSENHQNDSDPIFSKAYHQFMVNLLTKRDKSVKNELVREVKKTNDQFSEKLISDVNEVIEKQWIRVLNEKLTKQSEQLNNTMTTIAGDVNMIKKNLEILERNQLQDEIAIKKLQDIYKYPETFNDRLEAVEKLKPVIENLVKSDKDTQVYRSPRWTVTRIIIAIIGSGLLILWLTERFPEVIHKIFG